MSHAVPLGRPSISLTRRVLTTASRPPPLVHSLSMDPATPLPAPTSSSLATPTGHSDSLFIPLFSHHGSRDSDSPRNQATPQSAPTASSPPPFSFRHPSSAQRSSPDPPVLPASALGILLRRLPVVWWEGTARVCPVDGGR